jgi:LAO/AO transport system kinase
VPELVDAIDRHRAYLESSGLLEQDRRERARKQLVAAAQAELIRRALRHAGEDGLDDLVRAVAERRLDPHSAAELLIDAVAG